VPERARGWRSPEPRGTCGGGQPKLTRRQEAHLVELHAAGDTTSSELAEQFGVARSTVYGAIERSRAGAGGATK